MPKVEVFYRFYKKEIERSVSLILVILGNLVRLRRIRHSFILPYQSFVTIDCRKNKNDKVELGIRYKKAISIDYFFLFPVGKF